MREVGKEELREIQIAILLSIHEFCQQQGLRYSLSCGTLLGAVRHKGYIPWDDDIDIMMPRPDYEKFRMSYPGFNPNYTVQSYHTDTSYWFNFVKVFDNRTLFIESAARNGVYVDVFPIDGFPADDQDFKNILERVTTLTNRDLRWATKEFCVRANKNDKILHFLKYLCHCPIVPSRTKTIKRIDELLMSHPFDDSPIAGMFFFDRVVGKLPRPLYQQYKLIEFEGHSLCCIVETHQFLECLYGDYMQLPPVEQRVGGHNIHAYWL